MIVCNTTPLISLGKIGYLYLLKKLFEEVGIPKEVLKEIEGYPESREAALVRKAISEKWMIVEDIFIDKSLYEFPILAKGELEALTLAMKKRCLFIVDDAFARSASEIHHIEAHGTLFVILAAYKEKYIKKDEAIKAVNNMIENSFFLSTTEYAKFLNALESIK